MQNYFKVGDWVKVVKQGRLNRHIKMVGYVGQIEEVGNTVAQVNCGRNGFGAIELDCLVKIEQPSLTTRAKLGFV